MGVYVLDSNFFIQAHRSTYPLDVVPSFWSLVKSLGDEGTIKSIDKVKKEIFDDSAHEDELKAWCQAHLPEGFFIDTESVLENYIAITSWASSSTHYTPRAIQGFLETDLADPWLVALAMSTGATVITYETSEPLRQNKIKLPDVCAQFIVGCLSPIQMFRELGRTF